MSNDRIEGALKEGVGRVESGLGSATGNDRERLRGKLDETTGSAQNAFGKAKDKAQDLLEQAQVQGKPVVAEIERRLRDKPFTAIGIGVVLGWLLRGGPKKIYVRR